MNNIKKYKIAFVGWNPFQFIHIKHLASSLPNAVFILEKRKNHNVKIFSNDILHNPYVPVRIVKQKDMISLDREFDIIITQTMFEDIYKFKHAKIVMLQYGYAKEPHNYGTWRALASLCLTYGDYAAKKIEPLCPVVVTGNPKYDLWHTKAFHDSAKQKYRQALNQQKRTILYMPTWGDLSSYDQYIDNIVALSDRYNIVIKVHHNMDILDKKPLISGKDILCFGANTDTLELLTFCDIAISDYSGALFDAFYCDKPIVLLDIPKEKFMNSKKTDSYSLEFTLRDKIGIRTTSPAELSKNIEIALGQETNIRKDTFMLKKELFSSSTQSTQEVIAALNNLMQNQYPKTQLQQYIHNSIVKLYTKKCLTDHLRKMMLNMYYFIRFW